MRAARLAGFSGQSGAVDLQEPVVVAVDLERRVRQLEAVAKQFLEVMEEPIVVVPG